MATHSDEILLAQKARHERQVGGTRERLRSVRDAGRNQGIDTNRNSEIGEQDGVGIKREDSISRLDISHLVTEYNLRDNFFET